MEDTTARTNLERERERLLGVRRGLELWRAPSAGGGAEAPLHAADVASDVFEREKDRSILHRLDEDLRDVEDALRRLDAGAYGVCATCGSPLSAERLEAVPAARYCAEHEGMWEGDRLDLTVPAGRYEDGDAHTTDRAAAREAGRNLELVVDQDELAEPVEVAPEERALHLADPGVANPAALTPEQVAALQDRRGDWDGDDRRPAWAAVDEDEDEDEEARR